MAKITLAGDAMVITSAMKLEDLQTIKKYRPEALTLMSDGDNPEPIFKAGIFYGSGDISEYGCEFSAVTHDSEGRATITVLVQNSDAENIKSEIADRFGGALMKLNALEATLPAVLLDIEAKKQNIMDCITVLN